LLDTVTYKKTKKNIVGICHKITCSESPTTSKITIKGQLASGLLENSVVKSVNVLPTTDDRGKDKYVNLQALVDHTIKSNQTKTWWSGVSFKIASSSDATWELNDGFQILRCSFEEFLESACKTCDKGFEVVLNQTTNKMDLNLLSSKDRSINQNSISPVLISAKLGSLYSSEFSMNSQDYKNVIYAYATFTYNNEEKTMEAVVVYDEAGSLDNIPTAEIRAAIEDVEIEQTDDMTLYDVQLATRRAGKQKLYEHNFVKSYECKINEDSTSFKFGEDYFLGDTVTVYDEVLGLQIDAQLREYTVTYNSSGQSFEPTFGFSQPTLNRILKQKGVI
jgi:hypothetical protein